MSQYSWWLRCRYQSPQLGTGTANANSTLIRPWPSDSDLCWMKSNINEPGPLHRPTPKTPPSGITPNMRGARTMTGDIQGPGTGQIDSQSWTGCAVRAGRAVGHVARVANALKAGGTLKARGAARVGAAAAMKCTSTECGHPSEHAARARDALKKIGPANHRVPVPLVPSKDKMSALLKLKEEVMKRPQCYVARRAKHITRSLTPDHEVVKCLVAFGENTLKYAVEVLATIEWRTRHWKLQESFPVPYVARWLRTPELMQTMTPLRGELPLIPSGAHLEDIRIHSPATWAWIAVLLQYWQDHMSRQLYGGRFRQASEQANTLICDINPWLPHSVHLGWNYVASHATLLLDMRDLFADEHREEWEGQKLLTHSLNNLECNTEVIYWECVVKRESDELAANSREATAKELLPDQQVAHDERQARATPMNLDVDSSSSQADLYPNWVWAPVTKPRGGNQPRPYRTPRQEADRDCTLEEELDAKSMFDPLFGLRSQSSQLLGSQSSASPDTTMGMAGPKTLPHFSDTLPTIPPFDLALLGLPAPMSPVTAVENALLGLALGSPVKSSAPPGIGRGARLLGWSSCSDSPMSLGSPAVTSSLALALKTCACAPMPALLDDAKTDSSSEDSSSSDEEDMDAADNSPREGTD